jgi:hypothetical protein
MGDFTVFTNGRKTIGVFISDIYEEYQEILSKGISIRARELGYNVAFFTNFGGHGQPAYDIGERDIVNLPDYENLDGIIIAPDTMAIQGLDTYIMQRINKRCKCPAVSIRRYLKGCYNVFALEVTQEMPGQFHKTDLWLVNGFTSKKVVEIGRYSTEEAALEAMDNIFAFHLPQFAPDEDC